MKSCQYSYPAKARYDKLRDEYLTAKKGYTVKPHLIFFHLHFRNNFCSMDLS